MDKNRQQYTESRMIGQSISHYRITDMLGAGGMGAVYCAYDTQLERNVALKILPSNLASQTERIRRFTREAKAASAISHPNVAHIYEIGEANGLYFIAMELIEGQTLAKKLNDGPFSSGEIVKIASDVSDALQTAHAKGVIHRDIKPGNIMINSRGQLKLLDFGLAKMEFATDAATYVSTITETDLGAVMGTLPYMSPEQLRSQKVDHRTDIFSLGVVLYQLATGKLPFEGKTSIELADSILHADFPPAHKLNNSIPVKLSQMISKMLAKNPEDRYQSANEILAELSQIQTMTVPVPGIQPRRRISQAVIATSVIVLVLIAGLAYRYFRHESRIRWARDKALPEIMQLMDHANYAEAVALAATAEKYIPNDQILKRLWPSMSVNVSIRTDPPDADVYMKPYKRVDTEWKFVGKTPLNRIRIPKDFFRWKVTRPEFTTVYRVAPKVFYETEVDLSIKLDSQKSTPEGMVKIPTGGMEAYLPTIPSAQTIKFGEYWIDTYEVTNEEYKKFVDNGGYQKKQYWKHPFIKDGRTLMWEEAMAHFHDSTGRAGPLHWEVGSYREGQSDFPVTGVSWYEAAAYAEFAGKSLPTIYHWLKAAGIPLSVSLIPLSNVGTRSVYECRNESSMSPFGSYDMAGNVKEWCWNETVGGQRFILGGAYNEAPYLFHSTDQRPPFARDGTFGFRCVKYGSPSTIPAVAFEYFAPKQRDYSKERPVSDEVFPILKGLYS
jgi:eukaryotic-like serine/threonine-protein kinase